MSFGAQIPDGSAVLVDTAPIIYFLEEHPLGEKFESLFADIDSGRVEAFVTPITLAEVLVGPLKAGNEVIAERYRAVLTAGPGWTLQALDADISVLAARLRAKHRLKLPDAIQLATAIHTGCYALVTHDRDFSGIADLPILGSG